MKQKPTPGGIGMKLPPDLLDRLRRAAYWTPGKSQSEIVRCGIAREVNRIEDQYRGEYTEGFPPLPKKGRKP